MNQVFVTDNIELVPMSSRVYTDEGFLQVPAHVSRTGLQRYSAGELGFPGDAARVFNVLRTHDEVFDKDSLDSFSSVDITDSHPEGFVTVKNYKVVTGGTVKGPGTKDGEYVKCDLIVKDSNVIKSIENGKVHLSVGYTCDYDDKVPEGAPYEYIQRNIRVNHIAMASSPRAGLGAKVFDNNNQKTRKPNMKITLDSGKDIAIEDENLAILINDSIARLSDSVESLKAEKTDLFTNLEKSKASFDALTVELVEAKKATSDDAISERVKLVNSTIQAAKNITKDEIVYDSINVAEIQKIALKHFDDTVAWGDKSDAYIQAAFDIHSTRVNDNKGVGTQYNKLSLDMSKGMPEPTDYRAAYEENLSNSYMENTGEKK